MRNREKGYAEIFGFQYDKKTRFETKYIRIPGYLYQLGDSSGDHNGDVRAYQLFHKKGLYVCYQNMDAKHLIDKLHYYDMDNTKVYYGSVRLFSDRISYMDDRELIDNFLSLPDEVRLKIVKHI